MSINSLFYPRAVAVVGSTSEGKLGYELIRQMLDGGYQEVFAVNPRAQGAFSAPGYDAVAAIEWPVDLAVIVSPPGTVPAVLEDCGRAGVGAAVVITAGFSEVGNVAGEEEIVRVARRHSIRFVGPNCAGIVNTRHHLFPTLETRPPAGGAAVVAQSGAVGGVVLAWAGQYGLGISKFVSYGNRADLDEIDFLRYLATDPETQVVALYIESVADGRAFLQAVQECAAHKPVVAIKAGRTGSGRRATLSHTGSMAGADDVYDAALRQCGAIRVHTIEEMFDLCKGFTSVPCPRGRRVAIVTNSGGPGVLAADRAEEVGLEVVEPSPAVKARLAEFLPPHCAFRNPIDLTVEGTEEGYRETLLAVLQEVDAALALNVATPYLDSVPLARGVCDAAEQAAGRGGKPVVASFLPERIVAEGVAILQGRGVPNFSTGERAVTALARMADHQAQRASIRPLPEIPCAEGRLPSRSQAEIGTSQAELGTSQAEPVEAGPILEPEAMAWLRDEGIPVPRFRFAATQAAAVQGCREIGYPVVIKVVSPDIVHKSDCGGVVLDVRDDAAALAAFEAIERAAAGRDFRGAVIYPLIEGGLEVLLGLSRDPQFGPVVAFGLGGIYTEIWRDVSLRVAPVDRTEAEAMIREVKSLPLLEGARGQPPRDLDTLASVLVKFSQLPFRYPDVGEIDLNPVFLFPKGLVVGDVRVIRNTKHETRNT
ncbi:MAG TPA: acetate--CoA ligase family protein [Anaerolineae bacterium]|nr:acetate--CoA ligase family protein [Anaerolineae bacterium]